MAIQQGPEAFDIVDLYTTVLLAAQAGLVDMQEQMLAESYRAIESFKWKWEGRNAPRQREIIDTGNLRDSAKLSPVESKPNQLSFTLSWNPIDPDNGKRYGALVHDGQPDYFYDDEDDVYWDYTARPWTFLMMPAEDRDEERLNTEIGPTPESLPEDGWDAAMYAFKRIFEQELSKRFKLIG